MPADVIFWRDSAAWCPFCEMTWLLLAAMAVPYRMRTVPLRRYMLDGEQKVVGQPEAGRRLELLDAEQLVLLEKAPWLHGLLNMC